MIGQLTERITLATPDKKPNGRGGWTIDRVNADRVTTWASFSLLSVSEQLKYMAMDQLVTANFIIRNRPGITRETRIEWKGEEYEIVTFGPVKDHPGYTLIQGRDL